MTTDGEPPAPQSNQRGIEIRFWNSCFQTTASRLNRTSVGLKCNVILSVCVVYERLNRTSVGLNTPLPDPVAVITIAPQSNQRGIERARLILLAIHRIERLNRTSVGLNDKGR